MAYMIEVEWLDKKKGEERKKKKKEERKKKEEEEEETDFRPGMNSNIILSITLVM